MLLLAHRGLSRCVYLVHFVQPFARKCLYLNHSRNKNSSDSCSARPLAMALSLASEAAYDKGEIRAMKGRLLVVDDEESIRQLVAKALNQAGYECDEADGVESAQEKLREGGYDVLLTDKNIPLEGKGSEGGMELLRWARQYQPDLAVLVMTGYPTVESAVEALKLGAFDYLLKPISVLLLQKKVDRVCEYRKFVNPGAVLSMYLRLSHEILEAASQNAPDLEARLAQVQGQLDHVFQVFRMVELTLLDQRQRLAEIAAYAERARDELATDHPARKMLQHIADEAARRL